MQKHTKNADEAHVGNGTSKKLGWFSIGLGAAELAVPRIVSRAIGIDPKGHTTTTIRAMGAREIGTGVALLSRPDEPAMRWARVVGDAIDLGLLAYAFAEKRRSSMRLGIAIGVVLGVALIDVLASRKLHAAR
jgi:hypothetical protein